jgi:hypothetical protein
MNANKNNNMNQNMNIGTINSYLDNNMNNLTMNNNMNQNLNISNINSNRNNNMNSNNNLLINHFNALNLNNRIGSLYEEKPNYQVSPETRLILQNNQIQRGKLISNSQPISPTLQCAICMDLVMTPVECQNCSKLFCKECIDNWLKNSTECPNRHPFVKKPALDDWIKEALRKIFIKCPYIGCKDDYAYKHWTEHVKKCHFKDKGIKKLNTDNLEDQTEGDDQPFIWENVQFFVQDIHGHSHTFNLPLSTTVKELKEKLEEKTGFKVESQRLTCNGKPMENKYMLEFYGIQEGQTIYQLGRLKGGKKYNKGDLRRLSN